MAGRNSERTIMTLMIRYSGTVSSTTGFRNSMEHTRVPRPNVYPVIQASAGRSTACSSSSGASSTLSTSIMSGTLKNFAAGFLPFFPPFSTDMSTPGMYFLSMADTVVRIPMGAMTMTNRVNRRSAIRSASV